MTKTNAIATEMASKKQQFEDALVANGLTIGFLVEQIRDIIVSSKAGHVKLSAITMLLHQANILQDKTELTIVDGLSEAHDALVARRNERECASLASVIDK